MLVFISLLYNYLTAISLSLTLMKESVFGLEALFMQIFRTTVHDLKSVYNYTTKLDKYKKLYTYMMILTIFHCSHVAID